MSAIDPSFIRNIRDGLKNEHIEANNIEALPEGLVSLYDKELFPPSLKWKERKETLQFFLVFALAQKEISADFAATILGNEWCKVLANENETTEENRLKKVNEFIQLHSKRFTSGGEGKFRLYHERFRVYILQKVSEGDLAQFNHKFISICESELKNNTEKAIPEKERYALEFLSTHFFISAMQGEKVYLNKKDAISLKNLAYNQQFWERQVKASKGFEWSKKMLDEMMQWASKFDDDEVIECALNKVDLYHQEQNDVPRIVQLVADGDIETALQRIEAFGENDKEGLKRKFLLYMLCLIELTLLDSKDKEHSRGSIEKILKHFNDNITANQTDLINWNDFFPSYLMFLMVKEWAILKLDYLIVYKHSHILEFNWIKEKGPYTNSEFDILVCCIREFHDKSKISCALKDISSQMFNQDQLEMAEYTLQEALNFVSFITNIIDRERNIIYISEEMAKQGFFFKAFECIRDLNQDAKESAQSKIVVEIIKKGDIMKFLKYYNHIKNESEKRKVLKSCILKQTKPFDVDKIRLIEDIHLRSLSLACISSYYFRKGDKHNCKKLIKESILNANMIQFSYRKSFAIKDIVIEYVNQGLFDDAINLFHTITSEKAKNEFINEIIIVFTNNKAIEKALSLANNNSKLLKIIAINSVDKFEFEIVKEVLNKISDLLVKSEALLSVVSELRQLNNYQSAIETLIEAEKCADLINTINKYSILRKISIEYIKLGQSNFVIRILNKFDYTAEALTDKSLQSYSHLDLIYVELIKAHSISEIYTLEMLTKNSSSNLSKDVICKVIFDNFSQNLIESLAHKSNKLKTVIFKFIFETNNNNYSTNLDFNFFSQLIIKAKSEDIFNLLRNTYDIQKRFVYIELILNNRIDLIQSKEFRDELEFLAFYIQNLPDDINFSIHVDIKNPIIRYFGNLLVDSKLINEAFDFEQNYPSDILKNKIAEKFIFLDRKSELVLLIQGCQNISEVCLWILIIWTKDPNKDKDIISKQLLEKIVAYLVEVVDVNYDDSIFRVLLIASKFEENKIAKEVFKQYIDTFEKINDEFERNNVYQSICKHLTDNCDFINAIDIASRISRDEEMRARILYEIGTKLFHSGREIEGQNLLCSIEDSYYRLLGLSECAMKYSLNVHNELFKILNNSINTDFAKITNKYIINKVLFKNDHFNSLLLINMSLKELIIFSSQHNETDFENFYWLSKLASKLAKHGREEDALQLVSLIINKKLEDFFNSTNYSNTCDLLSELLYLLKSLKDNEKISMLLSISSQINDDYSRSHAMNIFVKHFVQMNDFPTALRCANLIPNIYNTNWLWKEAYNCVIKGFIDLYPNKLDFNICLSKAELLIFNWAKHEYWRQLGLKLFKTSEINEGLDFIYRVQKEDTKEHLYYGFLEGLIISNFHNKIDVTSIKYLFSKPKYLKILINLHAFQVLINLNNTSKEKIQRYNRTLNLQWAIDIKNQLPN